MTNTNVIANLLFKIKPLGKFSMNLIEYTNRNNI